LHLPQLTAAEGDYGKAYENYITNAKNFYECNLNAPAYREFYKHKCPYPNKPVKVFLVLDVGNGFSQNDENWKCMLSNPSGNVYVLVLADREQLKQTPRDSHPDAVEEPNKATKPSEGKTKPSEGKTFCETIKEQPAVIVLNADHLRDSGISISKGISLERTAYDLTAHIRARNTPLGRLAKGVHLVIRLGLSGVLHYDGTKELPLSLLYYDSKYIEGEYENSVPGRLPGYSALLAATIAVQLLEEIESRFASAGAIPERKEIRAILGHALDNAIRHGIANCRTCHCYGMGDQASGLKDNIQNWDQSLLRGKWPEANEDKKKKAEEHPGGAHTADCPIHLKEQALVHKVCKVGVVDDPKWTILGTKRIEYSVVSKRIVQLGFEEVCKNREGKNDAHI
ncbi:MAG: hypothetical protein ACRD39_06320, partial [Nitrososphaeraceae archaeon]